MLERSELGELRRTQSTTRYLVWMAPRIVMDCPKFPIIGCVDISYTYMKLRRKGKGAMTGRKEPRASITV